MTHSTVVEAGDATMLLSKRDFHNDKDSTYWLPKDKVEKNRLIRQHYVIKGIFEGNFLKSIEEALDFNKDISILDVGCGSGIWIVDMIKDYPNCSYHGCDIADFTQEVINSNQFTFSYGNVAKGLPYPDNWFDFTHMRLLVLALREEEWPIAIRELLRVTKPGGMIQLLEIDHKLTGNTIVQAFLASIHAICKSRDQNPCIAIELKKIVSVIGNAKIVQADYMIADLSTEESRKKNMHWIWEDVLKSMLPTIAPQLGLYDKPSQLEYTEEFGRSLAIPETYFCISSLAIQKI
ncbi:hypothetical protein G6F70_002859 [Rhizopus microsporus]|nr:hypothetical protein G6F71_002793 [Rhizopus microsporus]KAG1201762.1 hypothetical protein G6F70_002859 [Rhizopus microsporus]KAG1214614.1 hypothetical protein G6F69_001780 [Rhizopus microsporus]KAG1235910.1 hypothetical protein G6F67_002405 [Rhizopus microsporus]KAG1267922.1 hypothetical protein G6F68_001527 [Rhizopus microsporus]